MLNDYFARLFDYDKYANKQLLELIALSEKKDQPSGLMAHLLTAQQVWLHRCRGLAFADYELWPKWEQHVFEDAVANNHLNWLAFIKAETNFDRTVTYTNTKGDAFNNKLVDILGHVINHGTHHRAQIGALLKVSNNAILPSTDYIFYIRNRQ